MKRIDEDRHIASETEMTDAQIEDNWDKIVAIMVTSLEDTGRADCPFCLRDKGKKETVRGIVGRIGESWRIECVECGTLFDED